MRFAAVLFGLLSMNAMADVYLQNGDSAHIRGETVHCGLQQSEQQFSCTYTVCRSSTSILHISSLACQTHNGYETLSKTVWAYTGS